MKKHSASNPSAGHPSEIGSSVTLIFYRIGDDWYRGGEPLLNLIAAAAQGSVFTHVEVAIGEAAGEGGRMSNVLRVFNDDVGTVRNCTGIELAHAHTHTHTHSDAQHLSTLDIRVHVLCETLQELAERTGINPSYSYLQLGCSKAQEMAMLRFARAQVGKPFSSTGMARSLIWPRKSDHRSWYCAELVAACLQAGGLMSSSSSTGSATPSSLYKLYKNCGAVAANPCTLRRQFADMASSGSGSHFNLLGLRGAASASAPASRNGYSTIPQSMSMSSNYHPHRSSSPPRMSFRQLASPPSSTSSRAAQGGAYGARGTDVRMVGLTLASLDMTRR